MRELVARTVGIRTGSVEPTTLARGVTVAVARSAGWKVPTDLALGGDGPVHDGLVALAVPEGLASPWLLGPLYEATLPAERRSSGVHYTPPDVAAAIVDMAMGPSHGVAGPDDHPCEPLVWDPACGGGAFLLAAADALVARGADPATVVDHLIWGTDLDPGAVALAEVALVWWAHRHGVPAARPTGHLMVADTLDSSIPGPPSGFDLVVGNPPFQGQLAGSAVRGAARRSALQHRWGSVVGPYTDSASLFMVVGSRALAPGGQMSMVLPTSIMSARDAGSARLDATAHADLVGLWVAAEPIFEASVEVCAPVLKRSGTAQVPDRGVAVRRWRGRRFDSLPDGSRGDVEAPWSPLALAAFGVPEPVMRSVGTVGDLATAAAGFRDEYYGLIDHVGAAPDRPDGEPWALSELPGHLAPLVTAGLIDPGRCAWGSRPVRFARRRFERPVVDLASVAAAGGRAAAWVAAAGVPKVVVATQTRVGEAAVDEAGRWVPSTPTVAVRADPGRLWEIAAVICSPAGTVSGLASTVGSGRSGESLKHSVSSVLALPTPIDTDAWKAGAVALRAHHRDAFIDAMAAAYAITRPAQVNEWWTERAPW